MSSETAEDVDSLTKWQKINSWLRQPHKLLGIQFAPIIVPFQRRRQTFAAATLSCIFLLNFLGHFSLLYLLIFSQFWPLSLCYLIWMIVDRKSCNDGSRASASFKRLWIWKDYKNFFPMKLIKTVDLDPSKNYLLVSHPHGILSVGIVTCICSEAAKISTIFPGLTFNLVTVPLLFWFPFYREIALLMGLCSAKREIMNFFLSRRMPSGGQALVLVSGGSEESLESHPGSNVIMLKKRFGFIKLALQNGSPLVPVYSFGENDIFNQLKNPQGSLLRRFQNLVLKITTITPVTPYGRGIFQYNFGVVPRRVPLTVVVGHPIEVEKVESPTQEQIDALHEKYVKELTNVFEENKVKYGQSEAALEII